jgi:hypothetical protein
MPSIAKALTAGQLEAVRLPSSRKPSQLEVICITMRWKGDVCASARGLEGKYPACWPKPLAAFAKGKYDFDDPDAGTAAQTYAAKAH